MSTQEEYKTITPLGIRDLGSVTDLSNTQMIIFKFKDLKLYMTKLLWNETSLQCFVLSEAAVYFVIKLYPNPNALCSFNYTFIMILK